MHLGRKWIYGGQPVNTQKVACRAWLKTAKKQDGHQRFLKKKYFYLNSPLSKCDMSFLSPFLYIKCIIISSCDLQVKMYFH